MAREGLRSKRGNVSDIVDARVDRLSELPDSVLSHVVSLLPTEEQVRTSILSKRWKSLWTCVHTLVFADRRYVAPEKMQFSQFVDRVLQYHRGSIRKMKLHLLQDMGDDDYDIRNWITYAIDRGVEILHLSSLGMKFRWPFDLFNSQTLVDLSFNCVDITNLNIPSAPFFPSLKKLEIVISKFDFGSLHRLISGCLVLEDLNIMMMSVDQVLLNLSSSTLKRLAVYFSCAAYNINHAYNHKIELDVPALEFLRMPPTELFVKDQLSSLTEVNIDIVSTVMDVNEDLYCHSLVNLMEHISNVKVLRLDCEFEKLLTYAMNAKFPNLTELEIVSSFFEWPLLGCFMESSINLECIKLNRWDSDEENQVFWIDPQNVPHCLLSSLRKIFIQGYRIENALDMVDYVLRNAMLLERMEIERIDFDGDYKAQCEILLKLVTIKRASRGCEISFV